MRSGQSIGPGLLHNRPEVYPENRVAPNGTFNDYQEHKIRVWTNYNLDFGRGGNLNIGLLGNYDSALSHSFTQTSAPTTEMRAANPGYQTLPNFTYFFGERGTGEFDDFYTFDLALNYSIPVWKTVEPFLRFDVRNLLNYDEPFQWNTTVVAVPRGTGPVDSSGIPTTFTRSTSFGTPRGNGDYLVPREYFIGAGIRF